MSSLLTSHAVRPDLVDGLLHVDGVPMRPSVISRSLRDRNPDRGGERIRFTSAILSRWARRTPSLDALLPILYLRGVSMGDFQEAHVRSMFCVDEATAKSIRQAYVEDAGAGPRGYGNGQHRHGSMSL
jgi:hypothetical protein